METTELREVWFESEGTRLFAVESGDGPPVILLHGGLATHAAIRVFAGDLARRYRLITPDLRASGRSIYAGPLSFDLLADDVAALLRHIGAPRAVIGGISFGAACAVRAALRHPALTEALVVLHPAFGGADAGLTPAQHAAMRAMHDAGRRTLADGIGALLPLFDSLPPELRARARALAATYDPASVATTTAFLDSGAQPFARAEELAAITAPTLVVPGADPTHPPELAARYARHLPRCTVIPGEGPALAAAIDTFLAAEARSRS